MLIFQLLFFFFLLFLQDNDNVTSSVFCSDVTAKRSADRKLSRVVELSCRKSADVCRRKKLLLQIWALWQVDSMLGQFRWSRVLLYRLFTSRWADLCSHLTQIALGLFNLIRSVYLLNKNDSIWYYMSEKDVDCLNDSDSKLVKWKWSENRKSSFQIEYATDTPTVHRARTKEVACVLSDHSAVRRKRKLLYAFWRVYVATTFWTATVAKTRKTVSRLQARFFHQKHTEPKNLPVIFD